MCTRIIGRYRIPTTTVHRRALPTAVSTTAAAVRTPAGGGGVRTPIVRDKNYYNNMSEKYNSSYDSDSLSITLFPATTHSVHSLRFFSLIGIFSSHSLSCPSVSSSFAAAAAAAAASISSSTSFNPSSSGHTTPNRIPELSNSSTSPPSSTTSSDSVYSRGILFDALPTSRALPPDDLLELEQMALMSFSAVSLPLPLFAKLAAMLKVGGKKHQLEAIGKYMAMKLAARTGMELPSTLPTRLLPNDPSCTKVSSTQSSLSASAVEAELVFLKQLQSQRDGEKEGVEKDEGGGNGSGKAEHADENLEYRQRKSTEELEQIAVAHAQDRRHKIFHISYSSEAALGATAHLYPGFFASALRVLLELSRRAPDFQPRRILEYGAKAAPAIAAAHSVWEDSVYDAVAVEPSMHLTNIGQYLTSDWPHVRWQAALYEDLSSYDLIICSFCLTDLRDQESRDSVIKSLWNKLTDSGTLVILERGTPTGFRMIHRIRELFIVDLGRRRFHFVAPCPHEGYCPMALTGRDWCHFAQPAHRIPHYIFSKGSRRRPLDYWKFSFLVVRKGPGPRDKYSSELFAPTAAEKSYFWPRIVLPVIGRGEHVLLDVCSAPNNFERLGVSKARRHSHGYKFARKAMWGDLWRYPKRICRPEARDYMSAKVRAKIVRLERRKKGYVGADRHPLAKEEVERIQKQLRANYGS